MKRRRVAAHPTLVVALLLLASCAPREEHAPRTPMIVVGVDGADWKVIEELWRQGRLPTLRALADRGSRAVLGTSYAASPVIWSTIATGVVPTVHGITGFVEATDEGDIPVSSGMRRVPALWNMLSSLERRTLVVGWWATWPAEEIAGVVISDRILEPIDRRFAPASLAVEIERGLAAAAAEPSLFAAVEDGGARDRAMAWFARRLAAEDFDLSLVYFRSPDLASHFHWGSFESASRDGESIERASRSGEPIESASRGAEPIFLAYEAVDAAIAEILAAVQRPANVIVVSDHGFRAARRELVKMAFDLDALLERLGYVARGEDGGVDLERSRVYTFASGRTQANKTVRFGASTSGVAAAASSRSELRAALERDLARVTWADGTAALAVAAPTARHARRGADLLVQVRTDDAVAPLLLDGAPLDGVVGEIRRISGSHGASTDGILIAAGPDIAAGAALDGIHIRDLAPTILYGLDAPVAKDFAGRPWRELYTSAFRSEHPVRTIPSWGTRDATAAASSSVDEKLLEELRALGYLD